jgi:thymidylate synthase ThyX
MIHAEINKDSISPRGERITTWILTYPHIIHSEIMTHRLFSRNSSSSRAVPYEKLRDIVKKYPFLPNAYQKKHKGMQGKEYLNELDTENAEYEWLNARDYTVTKADILNDIKVTKQLSNRLLEPFTWKTVLVTATHFDNFFNLRCPKYIQEYYATPESLEISNIYFKSKKDFISFSEKRNLWIPETEEGWRDLNQGQAEIHLMELAEKMWDKYNESIPIELDFGQWHIPFSDDLNLERLRTEIPLGQTYKNFYIEFSIKIATSRCARISYTTIEESKESHYKKDIELHNRLLNEMHMSPFEHCARVLTKDEYENIGKKIYKGGKYIFEKGWVDNFKGFMSYRNIIENNNLI